MGLLSNGARFACAAGLVAALTAGQAHAQTACALPTQTAPAAPAPAASAGYTVNTFSTSAFTPSNVDVGKTFASGFQWYAYNWFSATPSLSSVTINSDSSISVGQPPVSYNAGTLNSAAYKSGSPGFVGTAFGGGAYIQAVLKFTPASLPTSTWWPAFWSSALESFLGTDAWTGQPSGYIHFFEGDVMEYFEGEFSNSLNSYGGSVHDWYIDGGSLSNYGIQNNATVPQSSFSNYNTYGMLWVPATSTTNGSITFYFNGTAIGSQSYTQFTNQSPPPSSSTPWAFGIVDQQHLVLELESNNTYPITVQSVSVWQKSSANNLVN